MECEADRLAVMMLATRCLAFDSVTRFAAGGLVSELTDRPQRQVHAWLAWPASVAASGEVDAPSPLGLAALVVANAGERPRFSIAWLLVDPEARRRGVASSLVAHAVGKARQLGAERVHAETSTSWPAAVGFWRSVGVEQEWRQ